MEKFVEYIKMSAIGEANFQQVYGISPIRMCTEHIMWQEIQMVKDFIKIWAKVIKNPQIMPIVTHLPSIKVSSISTVKNLPT